MSDLMQVAVVHALDQFLAVEEVSLPRPGSGEVPGKITASGAGYGVAHIHKRPQGRINETFDAPRPGLVDGRIVIPFHDTENRS